jgi:lipoprotein-anchoring transpeptidase ErfK/SrfK
MRKTFVHTLSGILIGSSMLLSLVQPVSAQTPSGDFTATPEGTATVQTATIAPTQNDSNPDQSLCLPYLDSMETTNCLNAGPSATLTQLAASGITFPAAPLTVVTPPYDLNNIPYSYAKVVNDAIPMYASVEDAVAGNVKEMMPLGKFKYVSLNQKQVGADGITYYQIANQNWISSTVISRVSATYFQGYLIKSLPSVTFAWVVLSQVPSYTAPGYSSPKTGKLYNRQDIVRCYDSEEIDNVEWVRIGPDEWIEHRFIGRVINNPTPPAGVTNGRWIEVNLYEQVLTVYDNNQLIFATLISSGGAPFYTKPGTFQIYRKVDFEYMTGAFEADRSDYYYIEQVPYIMYFDEARALHGAYWNNYLGNVGSHGCVNLSVADAHWLFNWANEGDTVYVWDPSGQTPTDSSLYGSGAF